MLERYQCVEKLGRAAWTLLALLLLFAPTLACARLASPAKEFCLLGPARSGTVAGVGDPGIGGLLATRQGGVVKHALSDLRGNVAGLVDGSGVPTFNPRYGAFGPLAAPTLNAPSFATRWRDPTGLYYFGGRYYDAATGRFLSPDPARFADSRNLYAYCGNDPVNNCDPDGMLEAQFSAAQAPALDVPQPVQSSYDASVVDRVQYHADPAADGRYGYVNRTQGGAAAAMLAMGDALGVTTLYEAMTGRNLSSGQWMTADEQRQSQIMAGVTLATLAIPVVGLESRAGVGAGGMEARAAMAAETEAASAEMRTATLAAKSRTTTVIGSLDDVAVFKGRPGYNVLNVPESVVAKMSPAEFDRLNAEWLNSSLQRGDRIMAVTDPAAHAQYLDRIRPGLSSASRYLNLELPMLEEFGAIVPKKMSYPPVVPFYMNR